MLERELESLGRQLDYPPTPPIAEAVAHALRARRATRRRPTRRVLALAALLTLLLAGTVAATVFDVFSLRGAKVERGERPPAAVAPPGAPLDLGRRLPLAEARAQAEFRVLVPAAAGPPDAVYLRDAPPGGEVTLAYGPRPFDLLVSEFRGDLAPEYLGKVAPEATSVERLVVGGERAIWIEGAPHFFFYRGPDGRPRDGMVRLAGNVLLVERGRLLVRFEGRRIARARAIELARSLR